jgi:hypothetical protein
MRKFNSFEELKKFEESIFNRELNPEIKYSVDLEMESQVKYDFLKEKHGNLVDEVLESKGINKKDLAKENLYHSVLNSLEK